MVTPDRSTSGDFLATTATPGFDAVVGNPPYVRYQGFTGQARATGLAAALAQGVRLSKLASSWAPFVVHTAGYLAPGGRLALVLPAELLSANYGQEVRDFLLERFGQVSVALIDRQVFPGVQTEALLLLAEGSGGTNQVRFAIVDEAEDLHGVVFDTILDVLPGQRWTTALVSDEATQALHRLTSAGTFAPLAAWGRLSLGAVTGNNKYFLLSPSTAHELGLTAEDTIRVSPPGSSHLRSLAFGLSEHADLGRRGAKTLMFRPDVPSSAGRAYIAAGEAAGVDQAYKCRVRSPWWRTPLPAPPDLFFTYMNQGTPQLAANPGQLRYINSVHGLYLGQELKGLSDVAAVAALNSVTALSAETAGRAYGGGVLKMEPREAAALLVPAPAWSGSTPTSSGMRCRPSAEVLCGRKPDGGATDRGRTSSSERPEGSRGGSARDSGRPGDPRRAAGTPGPRVAPPKEADLMSSLRMRAWALFDRIVATAALRDVNPWQRERTGGVRFEPDYDTLAKLLGVPAHLIAGGQPVGRPRAGPRRVGGLRAASGRVRPQPSVAPRRRAPGAAPRGGRLRGCAARRNSGPSSRSGSVCAALVARPSANILGKNYVKQVDVVMSSWATGPELMISTKRMDSSFGKNAANRVEESYGDAKNLRSRHPQAALGFLYGLGASALETRSPTPPAG